MKNDGPVGKRLHYPKKDWWTDVTSDWTSTANQRTRMDQTWASQAHERSLLYKKQKRGENLCDKAVIARTKGLGQQDQKDNH